MPLPFIVDQGINNYFLGTMHTFIHNWWNLVLFTAVPGSPSFTTGWADVTEAAFGGYARIPFPSAPTSQDPASSSNSHILSMLYPQQTFTADGSSSATIVAWGVMSIQSSEELLYLSVLDAPITMGTAGDTIKITPTLQIMTSHYP